MKRFLLSMAIAGLSLGSLFAQGTADGLRWKDVAGNRFWSNWEISAGGGVSYTAWDKWGFSGQGDFGDNIGWTAELSATKWFNPIVGARLQIVAGKLKASNDLHDKWSSNWMHPHIDGVINLSNWIGGYREDRVFYAKMVTGMGVSIVDMGDGSSAGLAVNMGMINTFRISPRFDINLELRTMLTSGHDLPSQMRADAGRFGKVYSMTAGVTYRFNERGWNRTYSQVDVDAYLEAIEVLELGLAASVQGEEALAEQLAKQTEATKQAQEENEALRERMKSIETASSDDEQVVTSSAIFFNINSDQILTRSEASLQLLKQTIMEAPKEQVFHIVGYADADTGTAQYNKTLSERRAKAVYDYLIKHGVPESQLQWQGVGSTENIFPINSNNRVVVVQ